jgi:hypothetical protein
MKSALGSFCFIQFKRDLLKGCQLQYVLTLSNCFENNWKTYSRTHIVKKDDPKDVTKSRPCMPVFNMVMAPCVTSYRINFERSSIFEFLAPKPKGSLAGYYMLNITADLLLPLPRQTYLTHLRPCGCGTKPSQLEIAVQHEDMWRATWLLSQGEAVSEKANEI